MAAAPKTLVLIRGLPGSGKTTLAKAYLSFFTKGLLPWDRLRGAHFEVDMFFYRDGVYKYDPNLLDVAQRQCFAQTEAAMRENMHIVVVSNNFIRLWELEPYITLANALGYMVQEIITGAPFPNVHGVPPEIIEKMRKHFQVRPKQYVLGVNPETLPNSLNGNSPEQN